MLASIPSSSPTKESKAKRRPTPKAYECTNVALAYLILYKPEVRSEQWFA
jgi:hypothetical protein